MFEQWGESFGRVVFSRKFKGFAGGRGQKVPVWRDPEDFQPCVERFDLGKDPYVGF